MVFSPLSDTRSIPVVSKLSKIIPSSQVSFLLGHDDDDAFDVTSTEFCGQFGRSIDNLSEIWADH